MEEQDMSKIHQQTKKLNHIAICIEEINEILSASDALIKLQTVEQQIKFINKTSSSVSAGLSYIETLHLITNELNEHNINTPRAFFENSGELLRLNVESFIGFYTNTLRTQINAKKRTS